MRTPITFFLLMFIASPPGAGAAQTGSAGTGKAGFEQLSQAAAQARATNQDAEAITLYQRALKLRPDWDEGLWSLCSLLYENEKYPEARDRLRQFVADHPRPEWVGRSLGSASSRLGSIRALWTISVKG